MTQIHEGRVRVRSTPRQRCTRIHTQKIAANGSPMASTKLWSSAAAGSMRRSELVARRPPQNGQSTPKTERDQQSGTPVSPGLAAATAAQPAMAAAPTTRGAAILERRDGSLAEWVRICSAG